SQLEQERLAMHGVEPGQRAAEARTQVDRRGGVRRRAAAPIIRAIALPPAAVSRRDRAAAIHQDAEEPRPELLALLVAAEGTMSPDQGFLHDVLRLRQVAEGM